MPKAAPRASGPKAPSKRTYPYPESALKSTPSVSSSKVHPYSEPCPETTPEVEIDKENFDPTSTPGKKSPKSSPKENSKESSKNASRSVSTHQPDYRTIPLPYKKDEIPCYDNPSMVRRKLNSLLTAKSPIPDSKPTRRWTQISMATEMKALEALERPVKFKGVAQSPSAKSLATFLSKKGTMGGGDKPCYYWGNVMLEKMRVWEGKRKSKARVRAEEE
ncbi:hypothetical protein ACLMJK_001691 [Lecanora helva]